MELDKTADQRRYDKALMTIGAVLATAAAMAAWFGISCAGTARIEALLYLGILLASMLVGGLVGFLFGLPRFKYDQAPPTADVTKAGSAQYRPSTNLDDVADWLTKIIVGVTLVQLKDFGGAIRGIAEYAVPAGSACGGGQPFVAAIIVVALIGGFLYGYIWTRLVYAGMAAQSDIDTRRVLERQEQNSAAQYGVGKKDEAMLDSAGERDSMIDDPTRLAFGNKPMANGRVLRALIEPAATGPGLYRITLTVSSTHADNALLGDVIFHLHPTFATPVVKRPVQNGVATLVIVAYGAFTVGADVDGGNTKLGLDLAANPDAPDDFKSR